MQKSTADGFIEVMAELRAIDPSSDEPTRHLQRSLCNQAGCILDDALRRASELAQLAVRIETDSRAAIATALAQNERQRSGVDAPAPDNKR